MKIKEEVFANLRVNYPLKKEISDKVGTRIVNIERWGQRKKIPNWFLDEVLDVVSKKLNIDKKQIFEPLNKTLW